MHENGDKYICSFIAVSRKMYGHKGGSRISVKGFRCIWGGVGFADFKLT